MVCFGGRLHVQHRAWHVGEHTELMRFFLFGELLIWHVYVLDFTYLFLKVLGYMAIFGLPSVSCPL